MRRVVPLLGIVLLSFASGCSTCNCCWFGRSDRIPPQPEISKKMPVGNDDTANESFMSGDYKAFNSGLYKPLPTGGVTGSGPISMNYSRQTSVPEPTPGNAIAEYLDNPFTNWAVSSRIDVPVGNGSKSE